MKLFKETEEEEEERRTQKLSFFPFVGILDKSPFNGTPTLMSYNVPSR